MLCKPTLALVEAALIATLIASAVTGCHGGGEDYSQKEPALAQTNIGTFSAAGSTFIAPLFTRWGRDYEKLHQMTVNYRSIGSGGGLNELKQGLITFAASDAPLNDAALKDMPPVVQIPVTAGPVCVIYNLAALPVPLKLSGKTLAEIYAGHIKNWEDPAIARENTGAKLPKIPIVVVHRLDGSGTTSIFTTYLSSVSQSWATGPGHGLAVPWPVGTGQNGSNKVLAMVKESPGGIGYVELSYAKESGLAVASIENKAGEFVAPTPASATLAINAFDDQLQKDVRTPVVDPPASAKGAYPITGLSFILIPKDDKTPGEQAKFKQFISYCLTEGQDAAEEMSYSKLPAPLLRQSEALLAQLSNNSKSLH
jgi:phosphate transport system substrate-binding protein